MDIIGFIHILPYELELQEVLEYFEGDILRSYVDKKSGDLFVEKWADCSDNRNKNRFLLFKSSERDIDDYLNKKINMLDLVCKGEEYWLMDYYTKSHSVETFKVLFSQLPKSYLPTEQAMHDETLRFNT